MTSTDQNMSDRKVPCTGKEATTDCIRNVSHTGPVRVLATQDTRVDARTQARGGPLPPLTATASTTPTGAQGIFDHPVN